MVKTNDARHANEKMRSAMDALVARHLTPQVSVGHALDRFHEAVATFDDDVPEWAQEKIDAVLADLPETGDEQAQWVAGATAEDLNPICDALLNFYAVTEFQNGRQSGRASAVKRPSSCSTESR